MRQGWSVFKFLLIVSGIHVSSPTNLCPGSGAIFTCGTSTFFWIVTDSDETATTCSARTSGEPIDPTCGPMGIFSISVSEDLSSSTLSVQSVNDTINGTRVQCGDVDETICVVGEIDPPRFQSVSLNSAGDSVRVEWSEPVISCNGSVSQYVLFVTPPTSADCGSGSEDCVLKTSQTHFDLTLTVDQTYNLTVRADITDDNCTQDFGGSSSNPALIRIQDGRRNNRVDPQYSRSSGVLESISLSWEEFVLQFNDMNITYNYTLSLSPTYLIPDDGDDQVTEAVTSNTSYTFTIPSTVIAEYRPSVNVDIPNARPVQFTSDDDPILSEELKEYSDEFSIDINSVCFANVTCIEPVQECAAYCGPSGDLADLTCNMTTSEEARPLSLKVPPPTRDVYHCIVSGSMRDDSSGESGSGESGPVVFRGRQEIIVDDCSLRQLVMTENEPECEIDEDDMSCSCTLLSDDGTCIYGVRYDSTASGASAKYFSTNCCYEGNKEELCKTCVMDDGDWSGEMIDGSDFLQFSSTEKLSGSNKVLIGLGVAIFAIAVSFVISTGVTLRAIIKKHGKVHWSYWIIVTFGVVFLICDVALWLAVLGYTVGNDFTPNDDYLRKDDSTCGLPSGKVKVRDGLIGASFALACWNLGYWLGCLIALICALKKGCKESTDKGPIPTDEQEMDQYDTLTHVKQPASPQPLLSASDPAYGKLGQSTGDSPQHYGKLDHSGKKGGTLPVAVPPSTDEYGKLDRSQMDDPQRYGKLDHPGKRGGTTLPGTVPSPAEGYGKLDRSQMHVEQGASGDMYDVVTNEPRHVPRGHSSDSSSKPRTQPGY